MTKKLFIATRILLLLVLAAGTSWAQNRYIVKLSNSGNINSVAGNAGMQLVAALSGSAHGLFVLNSPLPPSQASNILLANQAVMSFEVDSAVSLPEVTHGSSAPSPSSGNLASWIGPYLNVFQSNPYTGANEWSAYQNQPAAGIIRITAAHQMATGSGTVAILDTGIDFTHPALSRSVNFGWDFVNNIPGGYAMPFDMNANSFMSWSNGAILDQSTTPILDADSTMVLSQSTTPILDQSTTPILDQSTTPILDQSTTPILDNLTGSKPINEYGHGTMVAGVVHLVAPTARLLPVKVFDVNGGSTLSLILQGIYYAVDQGAKVISMSFSTAQNSPSLQAAITYANAHQVIVVAAAGNQGQDIMVYPAGCSLVEGVGSTNNQDVRSVFSNYGPVVSLAAPGEGIITTYPQDMWAAGWGTSFSAPMVAGAAALLYQFNPYLNQTSAQQALSHAAPVGQQLGSGRLDLYRALTGH